MREKKAPWKKSREQKDKYNQTTREKYATDTAFRAKQITRRQERSEARRTWDKMRVRAAHPPDNGYGTKNNFSVDPRWDSFDNFYEDMGDRPEGMTLDRKSNNLGYSKDNCRWATRAQQTRNRRVTILNEEKVSEIKRLIGVLPGSMIAQRFGVHPTTIMGIKHRRIWKEVTAHV